MTEKEKAKAYDGAIERAKKIYGNGIAEEIFPELKESEDDRIKKDLIQWIEEFPDIIWRGHYKKDVIAWLEKQRDKDKLIQELGEYKVKYTQEVLEKYINSMSNKDNERLRKTAIAFLKDFAEQGYENAVECIDWLEKQGEQKPTLPKWKYKKDNTPLLRDSIILNKYGGVAKSPSGAIVSDAWVLDYDELAKLPKEENIEPKFKVGNWYQCTKDFFGKGVTFDRNTAYYCAIEGFLKDGCHIAIDKNLYDNFKLWTIQDAKDGDVLYSLDSNQPFIYKERNDYEQATAYCGLNMYGKFFVWGTKDCAITLNNYVPATKEQRDALMKAMNDAGYEWDTEKKELKKLKKPKFDPKTLQPFDKVLVRDLISCNWVCDLFSYIKKECTKYPYKCMTYYYQYCIPYNDDTKHLLGTTDEAPEYYRYWKE